ncbi:hypothetical protein V495_06136 [Pseudogymnoascus sp. VKM F-4514 (FW-929)]|nr:hypothetical protein V495_06136 [Pseudogymnoascus sp. VKM F-4514 (FW-929)]KFY60457.1 hypothetical protein V497_03635 [Pseudogymnoascus sp. VKM F-4516 (FW-969)]
MTSRPANSNRPLPQVRGTPMNPGALTTQLNIRGTFVAPTMETPKMLNSSQHAQVQRAFAANDTSRPCTPPPSANLDATNDVAAQIRSIIKNLERQPPTAENTAQAGAMARNLAELRDKMDDSVAAQPRLSADAPEFMPSPSQDRGRQGAPFVGNERDAVVEGNPLNPGGVVLPTFTFTSESPGQPQQYTQEEAQTQIAAIFGSSAPNNVAQLPVVNGSIMASFHGHMEPITINPVTGRPRTPLSHLKAIQNNARRRSQERAEREAAAQVQLDQIIQQAQQAQDQQLQTQQLQAQQLQQAQQAHAQQAQAHQLQQAQAQALQAYQARQVYQNQQPQQSLQVQQPHQLQHFQSQQPSNGQIFDQIQQNMQFASQQSQQQYPFGMSDMPYGPVNHSHTDPQQQIGNGFVFNNMQDYSQGPPVPPFVPQNYDNPSMGQFQAQPVTQHHQEMVFNDMNSLPVQPKSQNDLSSVHASDNLISIGPNNVTADAPMTTKFRDTPPQTHSHPAADELSEDVAGYFPSAYELTGKWNTLPAIMRTPPQILRQQNGGDKKHNGNDPDYGEPGPSNGASGNGGSNENGNYSTLSVAKRNPDQRGQAHSRGPSQGSSTTHKNGSTRPNAPHTWRSHTHTISGDFSTLRRNAGHLDFLGSPAFPTSASEYVGLKADSVADKQMRLKAQLEERMKTKRDEQRVGEAMMGRAFYGFSAVLGEREDVWSVDGGSGSGFPSVAEMKREQALVVGEGGSLSGSPGRFFPKPKGIGPIARQGYMVAGGPDLVLAKMPREDWSVKSIDKVKTWENEQAWGEIVAKASKEAALKVNQIPKSDSVRLVGRALLERMV